MDKIHSANIQLFALIKENRTMEMEKQYSDIHGDNTQEDRFLQSKHRVTFSSDIEEYEDDGSGEENIKEIEEIIERNDRTNQSIDNDKIDELLKRISIEEVYSNEEDVLSEDIDYTTEIELFEQTSDIAVERTMKNELSEPIEEKHVNNENNFTSEQNFNVDQMQVKEKKEMRNSTPPCRPCNKSKSSSAKCGIKNVRTMISTFQTQRSNSANAHRYSPNKNRSQTELLKIYLNVRSCCEHKYLDNNRLPRYNGYISQYGLSKEMLELRESNRQKYFEERSRREREIMRAKQQITDLNEQAFHQWLIRKNRLAKPKYKNMYKIH